MPVGAVAVSGVGPGVVLGAAPVLLSAPGGPAGASFSAGSPPHAASTATWVSSATDATARLT